MKSAHWLNIDKSIIQTDYNIAACRTTLTCSTVSCWNTISRHQPKAFPIDLVNGITSPNLWQDFGKIKK
jgi:hypothetical protein